ncbi:type IX secretion system membrane protein PorP/SprF [Polaribacter sp. Asnod6-C07]|uniref:PorP/SprF family type IX secretion system membrane protein n=1 Tax=Polaribacter sp. Asnod6-C07 TaxID=3160582 RepID=UPI00386BC411
MIQETKIILKKSIKFKLNLILLVVCFLSLKMQSQQVPHYTQYLYNMQIINPAFVGYRAELSASILTRQQWVGVEGAPKTNTFSLNARTRKGLGLGLTVVNDKIGLSETTNLNLDASYTLITSRYSRVALGLKGGFTFFNNNLFDGITPDSDVYASTTGNFSNVGFGALFYNRKFYVGFSIPYLLETPQFYIEDNYKKGSLATNPNYFLSSGVLFKLSEDVMFRPSTMVRYTKNLPISVDINTNFLYKDMIEGGLSYRHKSSVSALFSVILNKKFRIGYAYDHRFSTLGGNLSSHEIMFHIDLNFKRNTRWLIHNLCYF